MSFATALANPILWIIMTFTFLAIVIVFIILFIIIAKKTHATVELKAWTKGVPIHMFFLDSKMVEWKAIEPEAGIVYDKNYGAFLINEKATYTDKRTKNVIIPYDANFAAGINVRAAKLADDLQYITKDEDEMKKLRYAISNNLIPDEESINVLKTSVNFGAIKSMMTALIPHNIHAKIEKTIAARIKDWGKSDWKQFLLPFGGGLFAIAVAYLIIKMATK